MNAKTQLQRIGKLLAVITLTFVAVGALHYARTAGRDGPGAFPTTAEPDRSTPATRRAMKQLQQELKRSFQEDLESRQWK